MRNSLLGLITSYLTRHCITSLLVLFVLAGNSQAGANVDDAQALLNEARATSSKGLRTEAINLYRRVAKLMPNEPNVRKELARLLASQAATRIDAEKSYSEAVALASTDVNLALERAANLNSLGDNVNAALEYRRAFDLDPASEEALLGYILQVTRLGSAPVAIARTSSKLAAEPADFSSRLVIAELFYSEARYNDALDQYALASKVAPDNHVVLRGLAESSLSLGYYDLATEYFRKASKSNGRGRFLANLARVQFLTGQFEAALRLLQANSTIVRENASALVLMADCYRALGLPEFEKATLVKALELFPLRNVEALERLARISFELKDKEDSLAACHEILSFDPQNSIANFGLVINGQSQIQQATAENGNSQARTIAKNQVEGEAALFWGQPKIALVSFQKAIAGREDSLRLAFAIGTALLRSGNAQEARLAFAKIAIGHGSRPDALFGMAEAEMLGRIPNRASTTYAKVLEIDPTNFRASVGEAEALFQSGKIEMAVVLLNELQKRSPDTIFIRERLLQALAILGRRFKLQKKPGDAILISPSLSAGDSVEIKVTGRPSATVVAQLDPDGMLEIPFLTKQIHVSGLTESELTSVITNNAARQLVGETVMVAITSLRPASLLVKGAVYLPGQFNIRKEVGLNEALMLAAGVTEKAASNVYIVRGESLGKSNSQDQTVGGVEVYLRRAVESGSNRSFKPLRAGDTLVVPEADTAFIVGAINRPGPIHVTNRMRLSDAVERMNGLSSDARRDYIKLIRIMPDGIERQRFIINLDDIEENRAGDVILKPGDIVEVTSIKTETGRSFAKYLQGQGGLAEAPAKLSPQLGFTKMP